MRLLARGLVADPARVASAGGDLAIETHRKLGGDEGPPGHHMLEERPIEFVRFVFAGTAMYNNPGALELCVSLPVHTRVGIADRIIHLGDAGGDERVSAGWGAPIMRARLKRDVHHRATRGVASGAQRLSLRVRLTGPAVIAFADDASVFDDDGPDHWIRVGAALGPPCERKCATHVGDVSGSVHHKL
jgi:hypothetical protein